MDLTQLLDSCRAQGTTTLLASLLRGLNDGYLLVASDEFVADAMSRGVRREQVLTLDEASSRGTELKGAVLFIDPHVLRAVNDELAQVKAERDELRFHLQWMNTCDAIAAARTMNKHGG